jgi:hypothetical protein
VVEINIKQKKSLREDNILGTSRTRPRLFASFVPSLSVGRVHLLMLVIKGHQRISLVVMILTRGMRMIRRKPGVLKAIMILEAKVGRSWARRAISIMRTVPDVNAIPVRMHHRTRTRTGTYT